MALPPILPPPVKPPPAAQGGTGGPPILPAPPHTAAYAGAVQAQQQAQQSAGVAHSYTPPAGAKFSTAGIPSQPPVAGGNMGAFAKVPTVSPQQQAVQRLQTVSQFTSAMDKISAFGKTAGLFSSGPVSLLSKVPSFSTTIKFPAGMSPQMKAVVGLANQITSNHYNYEWGGGHGQIGVPGSGSGHGSGPGVGFDCSGAVSAILHAAGVLDQPKVASEFMSYGQPGPGTGPNDITIYASPTHTFAQIGGKFFGTSGQNPGGGAAWFAANPGYTQGFVARHVTLPAGQAQAILAKPTLPGGAQGLMSLLPGNVQKATARQYAQPGAKPVPLAPQQGQPPVMVGGQAGVGPQNHVSVILGAPLSDSQKVFAAELVKKTGLDPGVVAAWVHSEQPPTGLAPNGPHNWLNIGATDSGFYGASNPAWQNPKTAADFTAQWLRGQSAPGFGTAAPGIQRILSTARQGPAAQIAALQQSGWAGSGYPMLTQVYNSIQGTARLGTANVNIPAGSGGSGGSPGMSGGAPSGGGSVLGTGSSSSPAQAQQQQSAQQQAQQANLQLLANFLKGSSNPWNIGPKTAGTGGLDLFSSGVLPSGSMDLGGLALQSLQGLAGNVPLAKPSKRKRG